MTRSQFRRRLSLAWWLFLLLALAPLLIFSLLFGADRQPGMLAMPMFLAALASLFVSLPLFSRYKRALIATGKSFDTEAEPAAWRELEQRQRLGFVGASLPAWIAAVAVLAGLEAVPLVLLALGSATTFLVYRLPRQLA